jgi:hypothetical protein
LSNERKQRFEEFVSWFDKHITGDEKGEGQIFLERLLQSFGNAGIKEVGAICEDRVKKKSGKTGFADLVWRPRVVVELKKRNEQLSKHYDQAFEYWLNLVPNRPKYMILCNFDEFWIYDLNIQLNDPVHKLKLKELPENWGGLAFLFPKEEIPHFNNNNVEVTEQAAKIIGSMFLSLTNRGVDADKAQRFVLQLVVALFAEDVDLIPKYTLHKILKAAVKNPVAQSELKKLFVAMSTNKISEKSADYKDIDYFNGGLFEMSRLNFISTRLIYLQRHQNKIGQKSVLPFLVQSSNQVWMKKRGMGMEFIIQVN